MKDRLGHKLENHNQQFFEIKGTASRHRVDIVLNRNGQNCLFTGAELIATFVDDDTKKRILVHYKMQGANKGSLNGIEYKTASQADLQSLKMAAEQQKKQKEAIQMPTEIIDKGQASLSPEPPFIVKYKKALTTEINYLRNNGGRQYKVT